MLSENVGKRTTRALVSSTLLCVCFLQCSMSEFESSAHVSYTRIEIGASGLVLPIVHILCW